MSTGTENACGNGSASSSCCKSAEDDVQSGSWREVKRLSDSSSVRLDSDEEQNNEISNSMSSTGEISRSWRTAPRHSIAEVHKSSSIRVVNESDFTIDKLQFDSLGQLYGREKEVAHLKEIFGKSLKGQKQLVLLGGAAGCGKSALALEARSFVLEKRGFYLSGKYAQTSFEQPYSAIAEACQALCEDLLLHRENMEHSRKGLFKWNFKYTEFLGAMRRTLDRDQIELLGAVIPSLCSMIAEDDAMWDEGQTISSSMVSYNLASTNYTESKQKLKHAFQRFVRSICSLGTLVVVLDDLQWADQASLELFEALLTDDDITSLMAIFTFRDNEIGDNDGFLNFIQRLEDTKDNPLSITRMALKNLDVEHINRLLQDLISLDVDEVSALGKCIEAKTGGNALYVKTFLFSLRANELLSFNFGTMRWHWDVDEIKEKTMATDNVVNLLTAKIKQLPPVFSDFLPRIACLGSRFSDSMFKAVADRYVSANEPFDINSSTKEAPSSGRGNLGDSLASPTAELNSDTLLSYCEKIGFLLNCGYGWHQWEHDKVREAVLALVNSADLETIQFEVGSILLDRLSAEQISQGLFVVTSLLNSGAFKLADTDPKRLVIAELNLRSGKAAFMSSAFTSATEYLSTGIILLPPNSWENHHEMTMDLYSTASEAFFCAGNFEKSKMYGDHILSLDCSLLEKRRAYNALLVSLTAQARVAEAKDLCVEILSKLGCRFPKRRKSFFVKAGILRTVKMIDKTTKKIEMLGQVDDEEKRWAMYLFDRLVTCSYQARDPDLLALTIMKGLEWTVKYGISERSGPILALIGMLLVIAGDYAGGGKFALLAMKYANRSSESRTRMIVYRHVIHFQIPNEICKKELLKGYEAGIRSGDLESAFWCICGFCDEQLNTAARLSNVIADFATYSRQIAKHNNTMAGRRMWLGWQYAANLAEPNSRKHVLTGDIMDEEKFLQEIENDKNDRQTWTNFMRYKLSAAFWFKEYEIAVDVMEKAGFHKGSFEKGKPGANMIGQLYFYCGLSCISLARKNQEFRKGKFTNRKSFDWFLGRMKNFTKKGDPNKGHYRALMEAELLSFNKQNEAAKRKFEEAIIISGRMGYTHDHALAHERLADNCSRLGYDRDASYHYDLALKFYEEWGAGAKVAFLSNELGKIKSPVREVLLRESDEVSTLHLAGSGVFKV